MAKRVTEQRIVDVLVWYLRSQGIWMVRREVRHYERRIDVVAVRSDTSEVWAIEAKVSAWRKAMSQAIVNLPTADRSYIAMYSKHAHRIPPDLLAKNGIGLISVGTEWGDVEVLRKAPLSPYRNKLAVDRIRLLVTEDTN